MKDNVNEIKKVLAKKQEPDELEKIKKQISLRLDFKQYQNIKLTAEYYGVTINDVISLIIKDFYENPNTELHIL